MDLQGPKIRVSKIDKNIILKKGDVAYMGTKDNLAKAKLADDEIKIPSGYTDLVNDLTEGARVLFDDGNLKGRCA